MSDSHGNKNAMLKAVALEYPEVILHLGDHDRDCSTIEWEYPDIPLHSVRGNCDRTSCGRDIDEFTLCGRQFFMTHGHQYGVKTGISSIISSSASRGADVLLFGHTHVPHNSSLAGMIIVNPGSIGIGGKTYAILMLKNGVITCEIKSL